MLNHWLKPLSLATVADLEAWQFGKKIALHTEGVIPDLKETQLAIIGINADEADAVRTILYGLSFPFHNLKVTDLGNLRKPDAAFGIPLLTELIQGGIVPIIIGQSETAILPQFQAYHSKKNLVAALKPNHLTGY